MPENVETHAREEESPEDIADRMWNWMLGFAFLLLKIFIMLVVAFVALLLLILISGPLVSFLMDVGKMIGRMILASVISRGVTS